MFVLVRLPGCTVGEGVRRGRIPSKEVDRRLGEVEGMNVSAGLGYREDTSSNVESTDDL